MTKIQKKKEAARREKAPLVRAQKFNALVNAPIITIPASPLLAPLKRG